jgi:hypothetical protein
VNFRNFAGVGTGLFKVGNGQKEYMDKLKIYLETTMFNFYFVPDIPGYREHKADVHQVFALIKAGKFEPYTSEYATGEIEATVTRERRDRMKELITEHGIKTLESNEAVERLAALYIQEKAIPEAYPADAAHIAITAVNGLDFIVSLNFEHIVRVWTIDRVRRVNAREGYKGVGIYKPSEVLEL